MKRATKQFLSDWILPPKVLRFVKNPRFTRYSGSRDSKTGEHLDQLIEKKLPKTDGYYVDVGANDGLVASNTRYFERHRNWSGVLIEPIMHHYFSCHRNRSTDRNHIVNAACVPQNYPESFVELVYSDTMTVDANVSGSEDHAKKGTKFMLDGEAVCRFCSPARTLTSILDEANAPKQIDLLSLDVEGAEISVLQGLDLDKYKFSVMVIESNNVGPISDHLGENGYENKGQISERDWLFQPV